MNFPSPLLPAIEVTFSFGANSRDKLDDPRAFLYIPRFPRGMFSLDGANNARRSCRAKISRDVFRSDEQYIKGIKERKAHEEFASLCLSGRAA